MVVFSDNLSFIVVVSPIVVSAIAVVCCTYFISSQGAIHKVRTQHGGGGVSTKCVQLRAGGRGVFYPMSAHAKAVKKG